jgi:dTMP kinase
MTRRGLFITFEGIEGSGKSTQISELARRLAARRRRVVTTREPGGTAAGDAIRRIFLGPAGHGLDAWTELFLIEAARAQHLSEVVRPALEAGAIVLCDRFTDSTLAYQGAGRGIPAASIRTLHRLPSLGPAPDLTILLDLPVREGISRAAGRNASRKPRGRGRETRIDDEPLAFHERVRRGFLTLARREPRRIIRVDAAADPSAISARIEEIVLRALGPAPTGRRSG